ncbi:MAG: thiol reductant ABC exporter subunit CydC [Chloroflexi bacterium]|nr:thiol reductant ABC exporter subunit CydC [Chloroflexota bacterium]
MYFDWRLYALTRGLRGRILAAALIGLLGMPLNLGRLALSGVVLAEIMRGRPMVEVLPMVGVIALLIVGRGLVQLWKEDVANRTSAEMKVRLREKLYRHVLSLGPGCIDQQRSGGVALSLVDSVEMLETFFGQYLPQLLVAALTPVIVFLFMVWLDVPTALVFLGFAIFTLLVPSLFHKLNSASSMRRRISYAAFGSDFVDSVQGLPTLKAFGQSHAHGDLLAARSRHLYRSTMHVLAANSMTGGLTVLGISAGAAVALGWGALRVQQGTLDLHVLLIVLMLGVEVFRPLRELAALYHRGMVAMSASVAIFAVLDTKPEVVDPAPSASGVARLALTVTFENVRFTYDTRRSEALAGLSFTLDAGKMLGVVGPSGAGKSTLVWLMLRFYDPSSGRILVGGRDLREIPLAQLRETVAVVTQDTYLFYGTVAENLRIAKPNATQAEIEEAARSANAHGFISELPKGYDTVVGERGARLSGGQRQRLAIARAILKDAPILVLDEALSSVDAENEAAIQQALERLQRGRTTLVIAHRLSSVTNADQILVLQDGKVAELGRHTELLAAGGVYASLMAAQRAESTSDVVINADDLDAERPPVAASVAGTNGHVSAPARPAAPARSIPLLGLWARLLALVKPWTGTQIAVFLLGLAHAAAVVGLTVVSALLVRVAAAGADLTSWLWSLGVVVVLTGFLRWSESWLAHDLAYRLLAEMRIDMYRALDPLAPGYVLRRRTGDLVSTVTSDVEAVEYFFAHTIAPAFVAVLVPAGVLAALGVMGWPLALALLPFLVAVGLSPVIGQKASVGAATLARQRLGLVNAHIVDGVQGLRTVAAFGYGPGRLAEITTNGRSLSEAQLHFLHLQAIQSGVIEIVTALGGLAVMVVGGYLAQSGQLAPTLVPLATLLALSSFGPVTDIAKVAKQLAETLAASRRVFAVHDEPVLLHDGPVRQLPAAVRTAPSVTFEGVTFSYGTGETPALQDVTFSIEAGQTVALVGRSGSGKTTAAHLILRFWDATAGRITVGGLDVRELRLDALRQQVGLVAQDTYLFNSSLGHNLKLARPDASDADLDRTTALANADGFVAQLPDGYETRVGERGAHLSGGQRQRIAIARALLKDAPILVLDEATSHLDAASELQVRGALDRLMCGRTTLVIAHRLSTIRNADKIVVLDAGRIAEQGTHDELLARGGVYARLVSSQLGGMTAAGPATGATNGRSLGDPGSASGAHAAGVGAGGSIP